MVYDDDVLDGYARDSGVTDKVIALKGGATYVAGGATAGSWTIGGITAANESTHTHTGPSHTHTVDIWASDKTGTVLSEATNFYIRMQDSNSENDWVGSASVNSVSKGKRETTAADGTGATGAGVAHTHTITQDGTARIAAAVVILVYLDLV